MDTVLPSGPYTVPHTSQTARQNNGAHSVKRWVKTKQHNWKFSVTAEEPTENKKTSSKATWGAREKRPLEADPVAVFLVTRVDGSRRAQQSRVCPTGSSSHRGSAVHGPRDPERWAPRLSRSFHRLEYEETNTSWESRER